MKTTSLLITVLISSILILFPSLSLSQTRLTTAPAEKATRPNNVFCCINGKVSEISPERCGRSQGTAYSTGGEAKKQCRVVGKSLRLDSSRSLKPHDRNRIPVDGGDPSPPPDPNLSVTMDSAASLGNASLDGLVNFATTPILRVIDSTIVPQYPLPNGEVTAGFTVKNIGAVETSGPLSFRMEIYSSDENGVVTFAGTTVYPGHFVQFQPEEEQTISLSSPLFREGLHAASLCLVLTDSEEHWKHLFNSHELEILYRE